MCAYKLFAFLWAFGFGVLGGLSACQLNHPFPFSEPSSGFHAARKAPIDVPAMQAEAVPQLMAMLDALEVAKPCPPPAALTHAECAECLELLEQPMSSSPPVDLSALERLEPLVPFPDPISTPQANLRWDLPPSPMRCEIPPAVAVPRVDSLPPPPSPPLPAKPPVPAVLQQAAIVPAAPLRPPTVPVCVGNQCFAAPQFVPAAKPAKSAKRLRLFRQ